jgi:DolP-mannose mannosyltransferase
MRSASIGTSRKRGLVARFVRALNAHVAPIAIFLFSTVLLYLYKPFSRFETGDNALYDYIAQSILRGQLSYRDVVDVKGPASTYLSALAMEIGRAIGVPDVIAVRLLYIVLAALLCVVTYLVAEVYLESRLAALIAALLPLMVSRYDEFMTAGTEPKLPMMLFGLLSLLMIARDRPLWAGVCSMLACLSWQPGLMFAGVAILIHTQYLTRWRDRRALKVVIGAGIPLAIVLLYFHWKGALGDLWSYTIVFNYSVAAPHGERGLAGGLLHLWNVMLRVFESHSFIILTSSAAGLLMFVLARVRSKRRATQAFRSADLFRDAVVMPPLIYLAFCCINLQGGPDLIPFFAFIGMFAGWFFVEGSRLITVDRTAKLLGRSVPLRHVIPAGVVLVILGFALVRAHRYGVGEVWTLQREEDEARLVGSLLGQNDKIFVHGTVELLVLLNKPNLNPYVDLDAGKDDYIAQRNYGGSFQALVDEIESQTPKIVAVSRLRDVAHRAELETWVAERYSPLKLELFNGVYVRR